jgi:hypothetical protein
MSDNINPTINPNNGDIMKHKYPNLWKLFQRYAKDNALDHHFEEFIYDCNGGHIPFPWTRDETQSYLDCYGGDAGLASIEEFFLDVYIKAEIIEEPYFEEDWDCPEYHWIVAKITPMFVEFFTQKFEDPVDWREYLEKHRKEICEYSFDQEVQEGPVKFLQRYDGLFAVHWSPLWDSLVYFHGLINEFEEWKAGLYQEKACGCPVGANDCYCGGNVYRPIPTMAELCAEASVGDTDIPREPERSRTNKMQYKKEIKLFPWDDDDIPF